MSTEKTNVVEGQFASRQVNRAKARNSVKSELKSIKQREKYFKLMNGNATKADIATLAQDFFGLRQTVRMLSLDLGAFKRFMLKSKFPDSVSEYNQFQSEYMNLFRTTDMIHEAFVKDQKGENGAPVPDWEKRITVVREYNASAPDDLKIKMHYIDGFSDHVLGHVEMTHEQKLALMTEFEAKPEILQQLADQLLPKGDPDESKPPVESGEPEQI